MFILYFDSLENVKNKNAHIMTCGGGHCCPPEVNGTALGHVISFHSKLYGAEMENFHTGSIDFFLSVENNPTTDTLNLMKK